MHKYDKTIGKILPLRPKKFLRSTTQYQSDNDLEHAVAKATPHKLEKKDILCFPIINWDFRYQRPQHLMSRFAKAGHRVFYFTVNLRTLQNSYEIKQIQENIYQVELNSPEFFDIYKDVLKPKHVDAILESFDKFKNDLNIDAIQHVQFPFWADMSIAIKKNYDFKIIFDCLDDFVAFDNVIDERIKEEEILFSNSDLITVSSSYLMQKAMKFTNNYIFLPNACEFDHFNKNPDSSIISKFKKPIIGYFGSIADWFDTELLEYVATKCPDYTFVMIGHTFGSDIRKLKEFKNVHFLGERPYSELPKYLHSFDVCLIPFRKTPLIHATHPIKIYEYMAAGKPVVATDMPELYPMSKLCYISTTKEDYFENIKKAVNENNPDLQKKRMEFASKNTWYNRFEKLYAKLEPFDMDHHN
ncbi:glycosyltransferase [Candidatus Nitrosopumilus sediminis]|uniref:Family 2 glycosyl transferase n=1 Tax=Candidatus Nitrosopumilus sediminis TaxID=1229909 RepID=K0BEN9_9ARCH|nr:glycosyltransferase [Candidatus Nitrosopumilus sediminis]AFS83512.1 family 2 glycosyl transferase [Candidatus Nitrosopumilus sediminis]